MPSRRALLAGAAGLVGAGVVASRVPIGNPDPWTPVADTWPLARRDLANTAAVPDAAVPDDPTVDWRASLPEADWLGGDRAALVVGRKRVYAGTTELAALAREDGTEVWRATDPGPVLALRDGRLFVCRGSEDTGRDSGAPGTLTARDAATGERAWRHDLPGPPMGLAVVNGAALVPCDHHTVAHETGTGVRRWTAPELDCREQPLVHRRALFMDESGLTRFQPRDALEVPFRGPPDPAWDALVGVDATPVGIGDHVVVGDDPTVSSAERSRAVLRGLDAASGDVSWTAIEPNERDVFVSAGPLAADRQRDQVYAATYRQWASDPENGEYQNRVVAVDAADGTEQWRRPLPAFVRSVCHAGGTVLVAGAATDDAPASEPPGSVQALAVADGAERWRVAVDAAVVALAPVDGTVFALTESGTVAALR